eukprot:1905743-Prymnesium_polylepis.1
MADRPVDKQAPARHPGGPLQADGAVAVLRSIAHQPRVLQLLAEEIADAEHEATRDALGDDRLGGIHAVIEACKPQEDHPLTARLPHRRVGASCKLSSYTLAV